MSHSLTKPVAPDVEPTPSVVTAAHRPEPSLISEQEVVFTTAVAAFAPPLKQHGHRLGIPFLAVIRRVHIAAPQPRPKYPRREPSYFEGARMSRHMERL